MTVPTFYFYPFSCSIAAHIILEESGLDYQRQFVDLRGGQHRNSNYIKLNPKGAVPALALERGLLTENQAILTYIADLVPHKRLIPIAGSEDRARAHEWMNYCAASLHSYVRMVFRPAAYAGDCVSTQEVIHVRGLELVSKACILVEQKLEAGQWSVGETFSVSDAYLFIMYLWSRDKRMGDMPDCPKWRSLAGKVAKLPSVKKIIDIELSHRPDYIMPDFKS